jgi:hypothetical protein
LPTRRRSFVEYPGDICFVYCVVVYGTVSHSKVLYSFDPPESRGKVRVVEKLDFRIGTYPLIETTYIPRCSFVFDVDFPSRLTLLLHTLSILVLHRPYPYQDALRCCFQ